MREFQILHQSLLKYCPELHKKRLDTLMVACRALLESDTLTLTTLGRNIQSECRTKHSIKRMDRLFGNHHLHSERLAIYRWQASLICSANPMPIVLVDWADIREQQRLMVLRASVAIKGRSVTLYERTFSLDEHNTAKAHTGFLRDLAAILPDGVIPLVVTDAGFKAPWFKAVEAQGWFWLGRVRGSVKFAGITDENWQSVKQLHPQGNRRAKFIGSRRLTKSTPLSCQLYLYKAPAKGRKHQRSTTTNSHHPSAKDYSKSAKEPWVLATNLPEGTVTPKQCVKLYGKRMQIEETFRDLKSPAYGFGLRHSRTVCPKRFDIMLLIALLVQLVLWWAGLFARKSRWHRHFQANTVRSKQVLSIIRLGKEVLKRKHYRIKMREMYWGALMFIKEIRAHGYALAKL